MNSQSSSPAAAQGVSETLPTEQVHLRREFNEVGIGEVLDQLDRELIGLKPVKTRIREIASLLLIERIRKRMGLASEAPTLHMSFTGNPGTGKTTVALRIASILHRLGFVRRGQVVSVTRDELVGQYIGHTAPKTKEILKKAMGGVLFIDEAYYLHRPDNERDYGQEAIEILLQVMESQREDLVVILAGYGDRMDKFFGSNPGFRSRIAHHIDFPDYADDELLAIAELMLGDMNYRFSPAAREAFVRYITLRKAQPLFSNARSIRNALDRMRLRQASRLVAEHAIIIIFGGSIAATMIRFPLGVMLHGLPLGAKFAFTMSRLSARDLVDELARIAEIARKQGPVGLEKVETDEPFLAKGIRYVADGYDLEFIRDNLERDRDNFLMHLDEGGKIYRAIGDCTPAFGMVGTLIGMVQMFANMTDPSKLGPFMATALLATLYGAVIANLFCLPIADKLHGKLLDEETNRTLIIDGILMIRDSKSPTLVREMLLAYLPEKHREEEGEPVPA